VNSKIVNLNKFFDLRNHHIFINLLFFNLCSMGHSSFTLFHFHILTILNKVYVSDMRLRIISINLYDTFKFFVGQMEIHSSKDLSELFGTHFLMSMSIPILEETLQVQSCRDTELLKSFSEGSYDSKLIIGIFHSSIRMIELRDKSIQIRLRLFESFHLKD